VLIVVVGVTSHQGGRESRQQGEGAQVSTGKAQGGRRNAYSHNCAAPTHACMGRATLESVLHRKVPGAFGEGPTEKGRAAATSPAAYSTQHSHSTLLAWPGSWRPWANQSSRVRYSSMMVWRHLEQKPGFAWTSSHRGQAMLSGYRTR